MPNQKNMIAHLYYERSVLFGSYLTSLSGVLFQLERIAPLARFDRKKIF
jgi:hypothetical protein